MSAYRVTIEFEADSREEAAGLADRLADLISEEDFQLQRFEELGFSWEISKELVESGPG